MSPRELLDVELRRRGRVWGDENERRLTEMRVEVALLHRRPLLMAAMMSKYFVGKSLLGSMDGGYLSARVDSRRRPERRR